MRLDNTQENQGNPMFPRILQLLHTVHRRVEQDSQTTIRKNKKGVHWQLGMGRHRTTSIRRTKDKAHHSTSTGLLRPPRTDQNRNGRLKILCSGILSQQCHDGKWRPVAYRSKTMSDAECNYDIHDKELLAMVQAFHEWKRYTRGNPKPRRVLTDHKNLVTFMTTKELNERQARWMLELSQYNFKIEYRPGKEGGKPDPLTRKEGDLPTAGDKRLTQNVGILLPKERYLDIPETEEIKLGVLERTEVQDKDEGEIQRVTNVDNEIQDIKRNLEEG